MEKLELTNFNTIRVKNEKNQEMLLEDFVRKLEKKTKSKKYGKEYSVEFYYAEKARTDYLYVKYHGAEFYLPLTGPSFEKCLDERKYDEAISRLKRLADISLEMEKAKEDKENEEKRIVKIIENAENGKPLDNEGRTIYLDYLKKQKIFLSKLKKRRKEFLDVDSIPTSVCVGSTAAMGFLIGSIPSFISGNFIWSLITAIIGFSFCPASGFCGALRDSARMKKNIKQKIKNLEEQLGLTAAKVKNKRKTKTKTETVSRKFEKQIEAYPYNFKDIIYKKASNLLDKIDCLNSDGEKIKLKIKVRDLLQEYSDGLKLAKNVGTVELAISKCRNIDDLQSTMVSGLVDRLGGELDYLGADINRMLEKQIIETDREKEEAILEERLGPVVIDSREIDGVLEDREKNKEPIRVLRRGQ